MTKEQFIKEVKALSLEFAQLCWSLNASESSDCSAEVYGSRTELIPGTIICAQISFSMQQHGSNDLTDPVKPATVDFSIGQYDSAKMLCGSNYFWGDVNKFSDLATSATELQITEYNYGKKVEA